MASDEKKKSSVLSKVFKKAAWVGVGFLIGGFLDFTLFHNVYEFQELIKVTKPDMNAFWYMTGLPKLAESLTVALGGKSREQKLEEEKEKVDGNTTGDGAEAEEPLGFEIGDGAEDPLSKPVEEVTDLIEFIPY